MPVNLISYTTSTNPELRNLTDIIVYTARVSNPSSQKVGTNPSKLITYLLDHKHFSPFEMADITVEIITQLDIATQILRHRSFSFQQFSQRYADVNILIDTSQSEEAIVIRSARLQDNKNRQSSVIIDDMDVKNLLWLQKQQDLKEQTKEVYNWALANGIAREVARSVLPQATNTRLYMKGSVRSFIHYIQVRTEPSTQLEHRNIAIAIAQTIEPIFPQIMDFVHKEKNADEEILTL